MICPSCSQVNHAKYIHCVHCGRRLRPTDSERLVLTAVAVSGCIIGLIALSVYIPEFNWWFLLAVLATGVVLVFALGWKLPGWGVIPAALLVLLIYVIIHFVVKYR